MNFAVIGKITVVILVAATVLVGGVFLFRFVNQTIDEQVSSQADDRAFLTTHQTIIEMHDLGINVDVLIAQYVTSCLSVNDFSAAVSLLPLLSDQECANIAYFRQLFDTIINAGGGKVLPRIMEEMRGRDPALNALFDSYYKDYGIYLQ